MEEKILRFYNDDIRCTYSLTRKENGDYLIVNEKDEDDYYYHPIGIRNNEGVLEEMNELLSPIYARNTGFNWIEFTSNDNKKWFNYSLRFMKDQFNKEFTYLKNLKEKQHGK